MIKVQYKSLPVTRHKVHIKIGDNDWRMIGVVDEDQIRENVEAYLLLSVDRDLGKYTEFEVEELKNASN